MVTEKNSPFKKINYKELVWEKPAALGCEQAAEDIKIFTHDEDLSRLLKQNAEDGFSLKEGDVVTGTVTHIGRDYVTIDIGHKSTGTVSLGEFQGTARQDLAVGSKISVYIDSFENQDGGIQLSKIKADQIAAWQKIAEAYEKGEFVKGLIVGRIKGGLAVDIGIRAFLPGSQIDIRPTRNLDKWLGKELEFKIIKFNKRRNNIVLSRRAVLEEQRVVQRETILKNLNIGDVVTGVVKNITDYGAFIDLGGLDGLLHVTDMAWGRRIEPHSIVKVGEKIDVQVLSFDEEKMKVSLGLRQMTPDPWNDIDSKYQIDQKVTGKVVTITDYGAFVEIEPGIEGLIHIAEMTWDRRVKHPSEVLKVDEDVEAVVLGIDRENRRISLGLKQAVPNPWEGITDKYHVGDIIRAQISNVTEFGIFVCIEEGVYGLVHVSDISWTERIDRPQDIYHKNDEIEAKIMRIDVENKRFSLSIKHLEEDPYYVMARSLQPGQTLKVPVTRVTDFGCFVELGKGVEGLIHNSELLDPSQKPEPGQKIECMVLTLMPEEHRFELSQKATTQMTPRYKKIIESSLMSSKTEMSEAFSTAKKKKKSE